MKNLIGTITLLITIGDGHYSRIRVVGNLVDSITEPRKIYKKYLVISNTKCNFISNTKYYF